MTDLLIFPYNGNGIEAANGLPPEYRLIGFVDDLKEKQGTSANGYEVFDRSAFQRYKSAKVLAVPGSPTSFQHRKTIISGLSIDTTRFATVIHPNAVVGKDARMGMNLLLMAGVIITSNTILGNNVCVLPNTVIHHDVTIGDYCLIGSGVVIGGYVQVGSECYVGGGTTIINGVTIGNKTLIGMGSNVIRSWGEELKIAGNPAKILRHGNP